MAKIMGSVNLQSMYEYQKQEIKRGVSNALCDIKYEINQEMKKSDNADFNQGLQLALEIINKYVED